MLSGRFYPVYGGAEQQCLRLSKELIRSGHEALVLTPSLPNTARSEILESVPVHRVGLKVPGLLGSLAYVVSGLLWLVRNKDRYTVIHAHLASSTAVLAAIASYITGKPAIVKFAGGRATGDIATSCATWYGTLKLKFLSRYISAFVCPNKEIFQELTRHGFPAQRISIIPNGIDTNEYGPISTEERLAFRRELSLGNAAFVTVFVGRLEAGKGVEQLIDAWKLFNKPEAVLLIVGTGSRKEQLKERAGGTSGITFAGWTQRTTAYLSAADCFVLPSFGEGLPNSLIEAMSRGIACIGSDIGGINELLTDKANGLLVKPGDVAALAEAIAVIEKDPAYALKLGAAAREYVCAHLSIGIIAGKYLELYNGVCGQRGTTA